MAEALCIDDLLMRRITRNDRAAFGELVCRWRSKIESHCVRMVGDRHLAEDIAQDVMFRLWKSRSQFDGRASVGTYLWRITTNLCIDALRKRKRQNKLQDETLAECGSGTECRPESQLIAKELKMDVLDCLDALQEEQRAVLVLRHYEGLKFREIAEVVGVPEGTVCSRMAAALQNLARMMERRTKTSE